MFDFINGLLSLAWTIGVAAFNLYKELIGVRNDILAVALGVSPFVVSLLFLIAGGLKRLLIQK